MTSASPKTLGAYLQHFIIKPRATTLPFKIFGAGSRLNPPVFFQGPSTTNFISIMPTSFLKKLRATISRISPSSRRRRNARIPRGGQTSEPEPLPLGFFDLPPEIRLIIYEMCLVADDEPTLRSPERMPRTELLYSVERQLGPLGTNVLLFDNSVLRVCRTFYQEAAPVFYGSNIFHHSLTCHQFGGADMLESRDTQFLRNLQYMKHISLDINQLADCPLGNSQFNSFADRLLSKSLDDIKRQCGGALRSLEIQLLCMDLNHTRRVSAPLLGEGAASSAIRNMRPHLQSLTIIGYKFSCSRPYGVLEAFCRDIAPDDMWNKEQYEDWPGASLPFRTAERVDRHLSWDRPSDPRYVVCWELERTTNG